MTRNEIIINLIALLTISTVSYAAYHNDAKVSSVSAKVRYMHAQYVADFSDDKILMGASHNVFIGKVIEKIGEKDRGIGPETQFDVEVINNLKGELQGIVVVDQEGGYKNGILYVMDDNPVLLQPGSTYIFATRYSKENDWYTLNSYPTASQFLLKDSVATEQLKNLISNDPRVRQLEGAYKDEILLITDVDNDNTLNSYVSVQEKAALEEKQKEGIVEPTATPPIPEESPEPSSIPENVSSDSTVTPSTTIEIPSDSEKTPTEFPQSSEAN